MDAEKDIKLKVGELTERADFGRGIIRISAKDMKRLGIGEGDVVEIEGKRRTAAIAVRAYPADVGLDIIRMDGLERRNCGAGIGEAVMIRKAEIKEAKAVTVAPARKGIIIHMGGNLLKQNLLMRPLVTGDIIIPNPVVQDRRSQSSLFEQFFGMDFGDFLFTPFGEEKFVVVSTEPKGIVRVTRATDVELLPQATTPLEEEKIPEVTYEDLGGLHEEIQKVREMIELPLKHPELFERLGIEPPKGILLHGPPGCLTGEALVAIEDGRLVRIGELGKNLVPGVYVADLPVYPPAHAKAIHVYDVPETVEVITKSGRRLKMTPNHPLMTDKGWVEAEKLKVGTNVKIFNWIPDPKNYIPTNFILDEKRLVNKIKVPKIWDENLAELTGIFVAEGSIDPRRIKFTIHRDESELRERILSLSEKIFDVSKESVTERVGITRAVRRIRISNRGVWDFFKKIWTKEKIIPQEILLSPNTVAAGFLRGLFEGDGSVVKKNRHFDRAVTLKSKNRQLLEEVQILLLRWGIRSSIYSYKDLYGDSHTLKIRGKNNLQKYKDNIGFISKTKMQKLEYQLSTYVRKTPGEDAEFEPVREVRKVNGWERVYDFEVPTTHAFFSNGILSHNTGKTLLAKAVANESGAKFMVINGPEIMSKFYGESEENLRKVFEQAEKNAPSIIFIDEIDSIAPKREEVRGEVEKRVVSQILCLHPETKIYLPHNSIPIGELYENTEGKIIADESEVENKIPKENLYVQALDSTGKISRARVIALSKTSIKQGHKILLDNGGQIISSGITKFLSISDAGISWKHANEIEPGDHILAPRRLDFGEWSLEIDDNKYRYLSPNLSYQINSNVLGYFIQKLEGIENTLVEEVRKVYASEIVPVMVTGVENVQTEVMYDLTTEYSNFLAGDIPVVVHNTLMDGLKSRGKVIVIGATNIPNSLDPALRRPGRFDREIELGVPNKDGRAEILAIHTRGMPMYTFDILLQESDLPSDDKKLISDIISEIQKIAKLQKKRAVSDEDIEAAILKINKDMVRKKAEMDHIKSEVKKILNDVKVVNLGKTAEITYGYVGADIAALCKEAAMHALRRVLPDLGVIKEDKPIPQEVLKQLIVRKDDFEHALKIVEPSAMREVLIEVPNVRWSDIGGLEGVKQSLKEAIEWPLEYADSFKRLGIRPPTGILLFGPPGCGKTLLAKAVANESGANFISVKGPELLSMWVGESERHVRDVFRRAKQVAPAIIFFDEIDALVPRRGYGSDSHVTERVVSQLLAEISGLEDLHGVVVIAATNRPDIVDPALLRPGRFDRQILVPTPDEKARLEVLKVHAKTMPLAADVDLEKIAVAAEGYSGADLEAMCREAGMNAMRRDMESKEVGKKDFDRAIKIVSPSVTKEMNEFYESMMQKRKQQKMEDEILYTG